MKLYKNCFVVFENINENVKLSRSCYVCAKSSLSSCVGGGPTEFWVRAGHDAHGVGRVPATSSLRPRRLTRCSNVYTASPGRPTRHYKWSCSHTPFSLILQKSYSEQHDQHHGANEEDQAAAEEGTKGHGEESRPQSVNPVAVNVRAMFHLLLLHMKSLLKSL